MSSVSQTPAERARKSLSLVLQRLAEPGTAAGVAVAMGMSEATASRIKNERLEEVLLYLAHLGIKCVPVAMECYPSDYMQAVHTLARMQMAANPRPEPLVWE